MKINKYLQIITILVLLQISFLYKIKEINNRFNSRNTLKLKDVQDSIKLDLHSIRNSNFSNDKGTFNEDTTNVILFSFYIFRIWKNIWMGMQGK